MRKTSGVSLMLLIFLSLCLIIFSLLSLSGAVADETLSSQAADRTTEYYAAVTSANDLLAQIDAQLAEYLRKAETATEPKATYLQLCSQIGKNLPGVIWAETENSGDGDGTVSFSVDVDDEQILQALLDVAYPVSDDDALYRIHSWKIVNTGEWNADHSMNLFRGGNPS